MNDLVAGRGRTLDINRTITTVTLPSGSIVGARDGGDTLALKATFAGMQTGLSGAKGLYVKRALISMGLLEDNGNKKSYIPAGDLVQYCNGNVLLGDNYNTVRREFRADFVTALKKVRHDDEMYVEDTIRRDMLNKFIEEHGDIPNRRQKATISKKAKEEMILEMNRRTTSKYEEMFHD